MFSKPSSQSKLRTFLDHFKIAEPGTCQCAAVLLCFSLTGCGAGTFRMLPSTDDPGTTDVTGNWQITAQTTSGSTPFTGLTGSIVQQDATTANGTPIYTVFQALDPGSCYAGQTTIPFQGYITATALTSTSFLVAGQAIVITATPSSTGNQLSGSYTINSGCANGSKATITGIKVPSLSGSFSGALAPVPNPLVLSLKQDTQADGLGYFHEQGTITVGGISCFTSGTLVPGTSTISGKQVVLTIAGSDNVSTIQAAGVASDQADSLALTSIQIISGPCQGIIGTATLTK